VSARLLVYRFIRRRIFDSYWYAQTTKPVLVSSQLSPLIADPSAWCFLLRLHAGTSSQGNVPLIDLNGRIDEESHRVDLQWNPYATRCQAGWGSHLKGGVFRPREVTTRRSVIWPFHPPLTGQTSAPGDLPQLPLDSAQLILRLPLVGP
jgi:hypothetical protein